ncbi:Solute carrier family 12 member 9 [Trichoplax sp. H2]|nr:Solute carrier family 12 member 9 [Trichoplax sp. H2]|eukprot:RDD47297.1 Solute carrier family 12 member 9 [Trichoplax sp. H2]
MSGMPTEVQPLLSPCHSNVNDGNYREGKLSTFLGVVVPCILSIFSVILFLRLGFVVGQAGFLTVIGMLVLAYGLVCMTVLSISAISTNGAVKGGGAYFMISRALGPELGGSIGIIFYFANVFASALYVIGFTEAVINNFGPDGELANAIPGSTWWQYLYGSLVLLFCLIVCVFGAGIFAKTSLIIFLAVMVAISSSVVSFIAQKAFAVNNQSILNENETVLNFAYTGWDIETFRKNLYTNYTEDITTGIKQDFQSVFAVLFNGCTGIMAGANISGDLKNPSKAIPLGTLLACGVTFIVYILLVTFTSFTCSRGLLLNNYNYIQAINLCPPLITIGVFAATLSAALSTLIGASRILEAVARDDILGIFTRPFAKLTKKGEPLRCLLLSWFFVQIIIIAKELNAIAPIVTMFYLLSYGATNFACFLLRVASAPNFRPTFRFYSWHQALFGLIGCLVLMFFINALYATISIAVMIVLFVIISVRGPVTPWGDLSQAVIYHQVRKYLLRLDVRKEHVKYWRPQILLLVSNPRSCYPLIDFINNLKKGGLYILGNVIVGRFCESTLEKHRSQFLGWLSFADKRHLKAFVEITTANCVRDGARNLMLTSGLGGMKPNTVVLGFYDNSVPFDTTESYLQELSQNSSHFSFLFRNRNFDTFEDEFKQLTSNFPSLRCNDSQQLSSHDYVGIIKDAIMMQKNVLIVRNFHNLKKISSSSIDIWPFSASSDVYDNTYYLVLQLGCILHMVPHWSNLKLRVLAVSDNQVMEESLYDRIQKLLKDLRIPAEVKVVTFNSKLSPSIHANSHGSDCIQCVNPTPSQVNRLIRTHSSNASVIFTSLPQIPNRENEYTCFLSEIDKLSENLPPIVMAHGTKTVTCTSV